MKSRWILVALAIIAAIAFTMSVQGGRWWSVGDVEIGPNGSTQCFGSECKPAGLGWIGGGERFMRTGKAAWAGGLLSAFILLIVAAGVAARRAPRLAAKTALVSIATALAAGVGFIVQFPGIDGAGIDRGLWWFAGAIVVGAASAIGVLRMSVPAPPEAASAEAATPET